MVEPDKGPKDMSEDHQNKEDGDEWEPIFDIPDNLRRDGSNYVEWVWSLLDDGIDIPRSGSFADLRTATGAPLLDPDMAAHLDEQMKVAMGAAAANNHGIEDIITCCSARDFDAGPLADELSRLFFMNSEEALSRAKSIGEICDIAEDFCREAIYLKASLASDSVLPMPVRRAIAPSAADDREDRRA
ncbi:MULTISPECIES: hypothetical protein [unclassified Bradyrhizobium]|jgi:hypothetical protein|uniref:hypothetical protein n=1 Tax=unclassified Bradyrhizobium TaxID=2631580 RepID=UPI001404817F|nr:MULTISPECIES: hypothetical protein [unclassified Bradyrhizobium]